ncbi:MAG: hypothetical protein OEZ55_11110 [Nitrospinota bacterium]|nr:hypothetical protein [Nitrospinota bacterium]
MPRKKKNETDSSTEGNETSAGAEGMEEAKANAKKEPMFLVEISQSDDPNENGPVDISVNGYNIQVQRGVPVKLPARYVEVLKNARVETFELKDGKQQRKSFKRYTYSATPVDE